MAQDDLDLGTDQVWSQLRASVLLSCWGASGAVSSCSRRVPLTCHLSEHALAPSPRRAGLEPMLQRPRLRVLSCKEHLPSQGTYGGGGGSQLACGVSGLSWDTMWAGTVHLAPASLCQAWRWAPGTGRVLGTMVVGTEAQGPGAEHLDVRAPTGPRALPGLEVILWNPLPLAETPALHPPLFRPGGGPAGTPPRVPPPDAGVAAGRWRCRTGPGGRTAWTPRRGGGAEGWVGAVVTAQEGGGPQGRTRCGGDPQPPALTGLSCPPGSKLCRKGSPRKQAGHSLRGPTGSPRPYNLGHSVKLPSAPSSQPGCCPGRGAGTSVSALTPPPSPPLPRRRGLAPQDPGCTLGSPPKSGTLPLPGSSPAGWASAPHRHWNSAGPGGSRFQGSRLLDPRVLWGHSIARRSWRLPSRRTAFHTHPARPEASGSVVLESPVATAHPTLTLRDSWSLVCGVIIPGPAPQVHTG